MRHSARLSRRAFLERLTYGAGAAALGSRALGAQAGVLPPPNRSGIDHIVVVMMENRSFDHMLGWLPGSDGQQAGLSYVDRSGVAHATHSLAPDYQGCGFADPDHSYEGGRVEFNGGACDGWLRAGDNDVYSIGYYTQADLPFFARAAVDWTTCDQYFTAMMAGTFPNRFYQHSAQTDRLSNTFELSTLPTIWDRLQAAGLSGRYYFSDVPFVALWGLKYLPISRSFRRFLVNCALGTLPHVSFVEPRFLGGGGIQHDDHPFADVRDGQVFLNLVYTAVTRSPAWRRTLLVINYDEWGGFFEHVPPSAAAIPPASAAAGDVDGLRGFRVPCLIISPFALRQSVSHLLFDHTSVLRFIEWRWGLAPLTVRDATAVNLAEALDFTRRNTIAPRYVFPPGPYGTPCAPSQPDKWEAVQALARSYGWPI